MSTYTYKHRLLIGTDPDAQYAAITTKETYTMYILGNGKLYLGTVPISTGGSSGDVVVVNEAGTLTPDANKLYAITADSVVYNSNTLAKGVYYFDGTTMSSVSDAAILNYITNNAIKDLAETGFTANDTTIPTTKAVTDYVAAQLTAQTILASQFFRTVQSYEITADDVAGTSEYAVEGVFTGLTIAEGDAGLLFTRDDDMTDDGTTTDTTEKHFWVPVGGIGGTTLTDSDSVTIDTTNNKANLNIKSSEKSLLIDTTEGSNGVYIKKVSEVHYGDGVTADSDGNIGTTAANTAPDADSLVTETALVNYINDVVLATVASSISEALEDVVKYSTDDGSSATS